MCSVVDHTEQGERVAGMFSQVWGRSETSNKAFSNTDRLRLLILSIF